MSLNSLETAGVAKSKSGSELSSSALLLNMSVSGYHPKSKRNGKTEEPRRRDILMRLSKCNGLVIGHVKKLKPH